MVPYGSAQFHLSIFHSQVSAPHQNPGQSVCRPNQSSTNLDLSLGAGSSSTPSSTLGATSNRFFVIRPSLNAAAIQTTVKAPNPVGENLKGNTEQISFSSYFSLILIAARLIRDRNFRRYAFTKHMTNLFMVFYIFYLQLLEPNFIVKVECMMNRTERRKN